MPDSVSCSQSAKAAKIRIAKYIADCGICSRRKAEVLINDGRVSVDGEVIRELALKVDDLQKVCVDGKPISLPNSVRIWCFHKPIGCLTTNYDPQGRKTVFDFLPKDMPRVITIGRLDYNTEGLLLFTNSGELARKMELPSSKIERIYLVKIYGDFKREYLAKIMPSIKISGIHYSFDDISVMKQSGKQTWLEVRLSEGKNREIRRVFEYLEFKIRSLKRIAYGEYVLGALKVGEVKEVAFNNNKIKNSQK